MTLDESIKHVILHKDTYIALCAFIVGLLGWLTALSSKRIAKQAKQIAEKEFNSKESKFSININDNYRLNFEDSYLCYNLLITNNSLANDGVSTIELNVKYRNEIGEVNEVILSPEQDLNTLPENMKTLDVLSNTISFSPRETVTGCSIFKLPKSIAQTSRIDSTTITVISSQGGAIKNSSYAMRALENVR